jgi:CRP-like cAMP-binding protein
VALLFDVKRTASVICKDDCTVGSLSEERFKELLSYYPDIEQSLTVQTKKYRDHWKKY